MHLPSVKHSNWSSFADCRGQAYNRNWTAFDPDRTMVRLIDLGALPDAARTQLETLGVLTSERLLMLTARQTGRADLAEQSGVSEVGLLTCARLADMLRIAGIGAAYGRLLWRAGVGSIAELGKQDAAALHHRLSTLNTQERIVRRLPPVAELRAWVEAACRMEPSVKG